MREQTDQAMADKVKVFAGPEDVLCLAAINQPLVSEMQSVIRYQHKLLLEAKEAIGYCLNQIGKNEKARWQLGSATQTFHLLTESFAKIEGVNVDQVRNHFIEGSASLHRQNGREE